MVMVKILRNRSLIMLIASALVLAVLWVLAYGHQQEQTQEQRAQEQKSEEISKTQSSKNVEIVKEAMTERDEKICDKVKGDVRRDELDADKPAEGSTAEDKRDIVTEAEFKEECRKAVKTVVEIDEKQKKQKASGLSGS